MSGICIQRYELTVCCKIGTGRYDYDEYGPGLGTGSNRQLDLRKFATCNWDGIFLGWLYVLSSSVRFFDYPDQGTLQECHQYGKNIFPPYHRG